MLCESRSISTLVAQSGNETFQAAACRTASTDLNNLRDAIHVSACNAICSKICRLRSSCNAHGQSHGWQWILKSMHACMHNRTACA